MTNDDLSPMPTPVTEEPELVPGGADAIDEDPADDGLGRDLDPDDNPAVDDAVPDEISRPDDKSQAPDGEADQEAGTPVAGQTAEDGSAEPPA